MQQYILSFSNLLSIHPLSSLYRGHMSDVPSLKICVLQPISMLTNNITRQLSLEKLGQSKFQTKKVLWVMFWKYLPRDLPGTLVWDVPAYRHLRDVQGTLCRNFLGVFWGPIFSSLECFSLRPTIQFDLQRKPID